MGRKQTILTASTGAMVKSTGARAASAYATILASGLMPFALTLSEDASRRAEAPSFWKVFFLNKNKYN